MIDSRVSAYNSMKQAELTQQVQISMMSKAIDMLKTQGAAVVDLIKASTVSAQAQVLSDPMVGQHVNVMA